MAASQFQSCHCTAEQGSAESKGEFEVIQLAEIPCAKNEARKQEAND